jgi:hypothetical protein
MSNKAETAAASRPTGHPPSAPHEHAFRCVVAAVGPREWDLLPSAIGVERYGRPEEQYREFAGTYGFDVRAWAGYPVLREIRELTMTTWIMQNVGESPATAAEFAVRVASLRERDFERAWTYF